MFSKTRVAVLRGGPSTEYHISLQTGAAALANFPEQYHPLDVFIDRQGCWHLHGKRVEPHTVINRVDVVLNALHGEYGEDGGVQHLLEIYGIPFTGANRFSSALTFNKSQAKRALERVGIKTPYFRVVRSGEMPFVLDLAAELFRAFPQPSVIKPNNKGSSIGVSVANSPEQIVAALTAAFSVTDTVLVEEYIEGREVATGVIEGFREAEYYPLLPAEVIMPEDATYLDFNTRYSVEPAHHCPARIGPEEKWELQRLAVEVHKLLGLRHYSHSEFIIHPKRGIFYIETDTVPDLHEHSSLVVSLDAIGSNVSLFLEHLIGRALHRRI